MRIICLNPSLVEKAWRRCLSWRSTPANTLN